MNDERKKILQMLVEGKIDADQAERLLEALEGEKQPQHAGTSKAHAGRAKPTVLHVKVQGGSGGNCRHENVDIKIPIMLLKAGVKLGSLMPEGARGKFSSHLTDHGINIDLDKMDSGKIEDLLGALVEHSIDIDTDGEKVRIYCS